MVETLDVTSGDWGLSFLLSFEGIHVFLREVERFDTVEGVGQLAKHQKWQAQEDKQGHMQALVRLLLAVLIRILRDYLVDPSEVGERYQCQVQHHKQCHLHQEHRPIHHRTNNRVKLLAPMADFINQEMTRVSHNQEHWRQEHRTSRYPSHSFIKADFG